MKFFGGAFGLRARQPRTGVGATPQATGERQESGHPWSVDVPEVSQPLCPSCGERFATDHIFCPACGFEVAYLGLGAASWPERIEAVAATGADPVFAARFEAAIARVERTYLSMGILLGRVTPPAKADDDPFDESRELLDVVIASMVTNLRRRDLVGIDAVEPPTVVGVLLGTGKSETQMVAGRVREVLATELAARNASITIGSAFIPRPTRQRWPLASVVELARQSLEEGRPVFASL